MHVLRIRPRTAASVLTAAALAACSSAPELAGEPAPATADEPLVGGVPLPSASLNAIGTIGTMEGGVYRFQCTATLIAPTVVLTAKHCVIGTTATEVVFAIGPDAKNPLRTVPAASVIAAPLDVGGYEGVGADVAVYILSTAVTDVRPLKVAQGHAPPYFVGRSFTTVGFGVVDDRGTEGTRRAGTVTLRAVSGKPLQRLYPTKDAFLALVASVEGPDYVAAEADALDRLWANELLSGAELYVGGGPSDTQPCFGDSGGPLLRRENGEVVVYGVVSDSFKGRKHACSVLGEWYASLGTDAQNAIGSALPPCNGVPEWGRCSGDVAERCVTSGEGLPRVTRTDCSAVFQSCITQPGIDRVLLHQAGAAECGDAPPPDGGPVTPDDAGPPDGGPVTPDDAGPADGGPVTPDDAAPLPVTAVTDGDGDRPTVTAQRTNTRNGSPL